MMRFNYAVLLNGEQLIACRATSKGWRIINPRQLPGDKGRSVCAFIGGGGITGLRVPLPAAREAEVRRAVPFAVEEELATDLSENHFAIGPKREEGTDRDIQIASKGEMEEWTQTLEKYGLKNSAMFSVAAAISENTLLEVGSQIYGRINHRTFCLDANLPADVFVAMGQDIEGLQIHGDRLASYFGRQPNYSGLKTSEDLLLWIAESQLSEYAVNLRQGPFSIKRTVSKQQLLDWRRTAALIGLACCVWFVNLLSGTRAIEARTVKLQTTMNQILGSEFPEANGNYNQVLDIYQNGVAQGAAPLPSVVDVTALLYKAVEQVDQAQIRSFRYDAKRREAICVVSAKNFGALEVFSEALRKGGLSVSGGDARQDRSGVVGEFKLGAS